MMPFDAERTAHDAIIAGMQAEEIRNPSLAKLRRGTRSHRVKGKHDDARFDVIHYGGEGIVPAFSFREAVQIAKRAKTKHVEVFEGDRLVLVLHWGKRSDN